MIPVIAILAGLALLYLLSLKGRTGHPALPTLKAALYAHRGLHGDGRPENSLAAFCAAVNSGCGAELDVHLSRDGVPVVIHDSSLARTAGVDRRVNDMTADELLQCTLENTSERIPLFEEVLSLFDGKTPLIIELKTDRGNHAALCEAVCALLDKYHGPYAIESFDPRCLLWLKKHRPAIVRGQLCQNFFKSRDVAFFLRGILTSLCMNILTRPDFIAYRYEHRRDLPFTLCRRLWHITAVYWTLRDKKALDDALDDSAMVIFEDI